MTNTESIIKAFNWGCEYLNLKKRLKTLESVEKEVILGW